MCGHARERSCIAPSPGAAAWYCVCTVPQPTAPSPGFAGPSDLSALGTLTDALGAASPCPGFEFYTAQAPAAVSGCFACFRAGVR